MEKKVSENVYKIQANTGYYLICCEALGLSAWNSHSEEQCWPLTLLIKTSLLGRLQGPPFPMQIHQ